MADAGFDTAPKLVLLPDRSLVAFVRDPGPGTSPVRARYSRDHGMTWGPCMDTIPRAGAPVTLGPVMEATLDARGELHVFMLNDRAPDSAGEGDRGGSGTFQGRRIDVWYARSEAGRLRWTAPTCIWKGYTGSLNAALTLRSGRMLLPFSYYVPRTWAVRGEGLDAFTFLGMFVSAVLYSDDAGHTWKQSNDLAVQTPDITHAYGACEPVAVERADGSVWMLIRTQLGRLYESTSPDGAVWTRPAPTGIVSSDSPAGLVRLPDTRLVLVWNGCQRHPYAYGGRQVLHAALSRDEGRTWQGFREVARDPLRDQPPPPQGDHGTAYPYPVVTAQGAVLISSGQGGGRVVLSRLDPAFLQATRQVSDFSGTAEDWSRFGTRGVMLCPHPDDSRRQILMIRKIDAAWPSCAVWNFPLGARGVLDMLLRAEPGSQGLSIGLTDHFSPPFDPEDSFHNLVEWRLSTDRLLQPGPWFRFQMEWRVDGDRCCRVRFDGRQVARVCLRRLSAGANYLRIKSLAVTGETGGVMLASVAVKIRPPGRESRRP